MYFVRNVKTASKATAVQIIRYQGRKKVLVKHIGSAHSVVELQTLRQIAWNWIERERLRSGQQKLFQTPPSLNSQPPVLISNCIYLGASACLVYEVLTDLLKQFQFHTLGNQLLLDLIIMRIIQPASKLASVNYLSQWFGINYPRGHIYEAIATFPQYKNQTEKLVVEFAQTHYHFDFALVFYDVTTLYYESFTEDMDQSDEQGNIVVKGLRKNGFSKDLKFNQPQIVIGLLVNREGFPVAYEIFEGNTFEGDTFLPVILDFKKKHHVKKLVIVADAAMISWENVQKIKALRLKYIVGARLANISPVRQKQISQELKGVDGATGRIQTDKGKLVYNFSQKRFEKDRRDLDKQIQKATLWVTKNQSGKRAKFVALKTSMETKKTGGKSELLYEVNQRLIEKTKLLLGIKGYYTNLTGKQADNQTVIDRYHQLWQVEKAFRMAKSDLAMRPVYHSKKTTIEGHILICFMALAVCVHMEKQTRLSTQKTIMLLKQITDAKFKDRITGETVVIRQEIPSEVKDLCRLLSSQKK